MLNKEIIYSEFNDLFTDLDYEPFSFTFHEKVPNISNDVFFYELSSSNEISSEEIIHEELTLVLGEKLNIQLPEHGCIGEQKFKITNISKEKTAHVNLEINNNRLLCLLDDIIDFIIEPRMDDKKKAFSIWEFVSRYSYHWDSPDYARKNFHWGLESHDLVKYFNIYGYGSCQNAAVMVKALSEKVGLKSRIWYLGCPNKMSHWVNEIYYTESWHVFDADQKVYYPNDSGIPASIEEIKDNTHFVRRTFHPEIWLNKLNSCNKPEMSYSYDEILDLWTQMYSNVQLFDIHSDDFAWKKEYIKEAIKRNEYPSWYSTKHEINISLRPQESISYDNSYTTYYFSDKRRDKDSLPPLIFANGFLCFPVSLDRRTFNRLEYHQNIYSSNEIENQICAQDYNGETELIILLKSPYVIVGGVIEYFKPVQQYMKDIKFYISFDKLKWIVLDYLMNDYCCNDHINISRILNPATREEMDYLKRKHFTYDEIRKPKYYYYLKVVCKNKIIKKLKGQKTIFIIKTIFQYNPFLTPKFKPGNNTLKFMPEKQKCIDLKFFYSCEYYKGIELIHMNNSVLAVYNKKNHIVFLWDNIENAKQYHVLISFFSGCAVPVSSNYNRVLQKNEMKIDIEDLVTNKVYYWKVRVSNQLGLWGDWSSIQSFKVD